MKVIMERGAPMSACAPMLGLMLILLGCMGANHLHADPTVDRLMKEIRERNETGSIEKHRKWRKALPRCTQGKTGIREDWPDSGEVKRLRGVLNPGRWLCTIKDCHGAKCCNFCSSTLWFFSRGDFIRQGAKGKGRSIVLAGKTDALEYSGMDCAIDSISMLPILEVVVSGNLDQEGSVKNADICVIGELPGILPSKATPGRPE